MSISASPITAMPPSDRSRVRRAAERAHYDQATVHAIVDAAWVCHVAFNDGDHVVCIPTASWRVGDTLYVHGSNGSRMMKRLAEGAPACVTITHVDGLVMARSAFSHSMNYRSVVVHGRFSAVPEDAKAAVLDALMDHMAPGRREHARAPDESELKATTVLGIPLLEAAAKIRNWGPRDKDEDLALPVWAGVLPLREQRLPPVDEPGFDGPVPAYVSRWTD
ncbi:MAG TPA: pyridoxamine 5'-phosphate oxidase family protein [Candidatus Aquabacterium excrementipullorum]|nr:pyridoxamine 5'-phosphate oxidase family protein [Candidatus Aquabacterium excrementipullorum]